ncbi:HAMP domain-containing sensor histidine kinase [Pseudomonas sp. GOM6]|uniref:sensor histidine kinase n=1 Tax=Pseudomonas sp. GOM6 TaxID=3036944 RepID=UPI00240A603F|nr:HAMP domain-containing sensor histidine kinase [Pseudomonas sp. GOM6]MDG1581329.1 HAMP domain-containing sensor histidine kinase [Pseudomonas sp. GOM6]
MRSLFWRIFASFWLAIALVAGLSLLLGRALNQDAWVLSHHPALKNFAERWSSLYEQQGPRAAQDLLEKRKRRYRIDTQVLDVDGQPLVQGTFPPRAAAFEARQDNAKRLPWRRLTEEYRSPGGETYLFIHRIPHPELVAWQRDGLFWPLSALTIALVVLTAISLLLTLSITRPLGRLRGAVHDLGQTAYQQNSLAHLASRGDEFGVLARDFNRMGARLQDLIGSQRQLLRDVSHELRSPLARLRIALALAERANGEERQSLWGRLTQECDRLEALIGEILALARLDADTGAPHTVELQPLLDEVQANARLLAPEQQLRLNMAHAPATLQGWPDMLRSALDNLLRNALRFNPPAQPLEISVTGENGLLRIAVRDHGPGAPEEILTRLGEPFFRAPNQQAAGHGLGLAIARRAAERHGGRLLLENHPQGGFVATLELPGQARSRH